MKRLHSAQRRTDLDFKWMKLIFKGTRFRFGRKSKRNFLKIGNYFLWAVSRYALNSLFFAHFIIYYQYLRYLDNNNWPRRFSKPSPTNEGAEPSRDFDHSHKLDRTVLCYGPSNANCYIQCGNRKLKCVQCLDTEMMHIELIASYEKWILNHDGNLYIL